MDSSSNSELLSQLTDFNSAFTSKEYNTCQEILSKLEDLVAQEKEKDLRENAPLAPVSVVDLVAREKEKDVRENAPLPPVNAVMDSSSNSELLTQLTDFKSALTTKGYNTCQEILSDLEGIVAREKDKDLRDPAVVEPIVHELNFQNAQQSQEAVPPNGFVAWNQLDLNFNGFDGLEFPLSNIANPDFQDQFEEEQAEGEDAAPNQIPWDIDGVDFENGNNFEAAFEIPDLVEEGGGAEMEEGGDAEMEEDNEQVEEEDEMEEDNEHVEEEDEMEEGGGVEMAEDNEQVQQNQDQHEELPPRVIIPSPRFLEGLETAVTSSSEGTARSTSDEEWEN